MKRASYRFGVEWIALNDNPDHHSEWGSFMLQVEEVAGYISVALLADLFGKDRRTWRAASCATGSRTRWGANPHLGSELRSPGRLPGWCPWRRAAPPARRERRLGHPRG